MNTFLKRILFGTIIFCYSLSTKCQIVSIFKMEAGTIYLKDKPEPLSNDELKEIFQKNPSVYTENIINKYGNVEKVIIDPSKTNTRRYRDINLRVKIRK